MSKTSAEVKDPLTGLPRKAEFDELLSAAVEGSGAQGPVSLALVDIDRFLEVNTKHGHQKGDEVILAVGRALAKELAPEGPVIGRIGGDEFAVILSGIEKETAFLRLEQVRRAVAELAELRQMTPGPTISIGLATYPHDGAARPEIVRKADDALFRAKAAGRNRVALAREENMVAKTSHFTQGQLDRLTALSKREGVGEAELLREALDDLLKKYQWSREPGEQARQPPAEEASAGDRRRRPEARVGSQPGTRRKPKVTPDG